jgi:hypothetical protein
MPGAARGGLSQCAEAQHEGAIHDHEQCALAKWHAGDGMKAAVATATAAEGSGLLATKN